MVSVFDIASEFMDRAGGKIEAVKLEKLCFYTFGWYAHLTGEPLFSEQLYAMKYGPVVGQLLSAHAGHRVVDQDMLARQFRAWDTTRQELTGYVERIIDSVWDTYGERDAFDLAEYSHGEGVWQEAWDRKPEDSKRADLPQDELISYFLARKPVAGEVQDLPPAMLTYASQEVLEASERASSVHVPFIEAIRKQRSA
ncbi:Panacea domain-containing protein [Gleimia europaea]|uniref:Antitoxin SocA-like Panacea domain-containing protein n=1 Tax=Gleimia europaea ACS-120-V-Col10b TaxID=883069 RepID=A0A9W5RED1_9ACTO|nr:type II toxin-antitoxin system antitoxin SocA domain-containing protein [Gleimia europaea]EPD30851.1 hypothetical protein HMPREF9238_00606 [Gleimia europaea ACS-120-V-Col10b]